MKVDLVVANTIFVCVTAPENEDVGEIRIFGISAGACHFCWVSHAWMHVGHAGGPWGFTFGTRLGPNFWAPENIG